MTLREITLVKNDFRIRYKTDLSFRPASRNDHHVWWKCNRVVQNNPCLSKTESQLAIMRLFAVDSG